MTKKERLNKIFPILEKKFGKPKCALDFETPFQLMVAVILSAQCTDERVNIVTKELFKVVREPQDIRNMDIKILEKYIKSTGFYKNKSKNIKLNSEALLKKHNDVITCRSWTENSKCSFRGNMGYKRRNCGGYPCEKTF